MVFLGRSPPCSLSSRTNYNCPCIDRFSIHRVFNGKVPQIAQVPIDEIIAVGTKSRANGLTDHNSRCSRPYNQQLC